MIAYTANFEKKKALAYKNTLGRHQAFMKLIFFGAADSSPSDSYSAGTETSASAKSCSSFKILGFIMLAGLSESST